MNDLHEKKHMLVMGKIQLLLNSEITPFDVIGDWANQIGDQQTAIQLASGYLHCIANDYLRLSVGLKPAKRAFIVNADGKLFVSESEAKKSEMFLRLEQDKANNNAVIEPLFSGYVIAL
ncbi:hypothetical protein [Psychromonas aquimarina]|uniref:hypothetical protein n=1 Tax=Psychromonas aquimarina TaxID=444919 RepID=UPI00048D9595|nr:hypothetical protein [Psychromonas aquimarina]